MTDSAHAAARESVDEQLRYPQRLPRTVVVLHWNSVPQSVQHRLEEDARVSRSIDYTQLPRRWWRTNSPGLSTDELPIVEAAATTVQWPTILDADETRRLTAVEGIVDRVATHPVGQHPAASGKRSIVAPHMESHAIAAATSMLITTPEVPAHAAPASYLRQEWGSAAGRIRAQSRCAHRADPSLRLIEQALDHMHRLAEDLRTTQQILGAINFAGALPPFSIGG